MDVSDDTYNTYYVNNNKADKQTKVYENFSVLMTKTELATTYAELFAEEEEAEKNVEDVSDDQSAALWKEESAVPEDENKDIRKGRRFVQKSNLLSFYE